MKTINYNTGVGNLTAETISEAKSIADDNCQYTQADITIEEDEEVIARRKWYGFEFNEENDGSEDPIRFGSFGYYADWDA